MKKNLMKVETRTKQKLNVSKPKHSQKLVEVVEEVQALQQVLQQADLQNAEFQEIVAQQVVVAEVDNF
jgi:malonyl CoA-acyl carrier protein transacylase